MAVLEQFSSRVLHQLSGSMPASTPGAAGTMTLDSTAGLPATGQFRLQVGTGEIVLVTGAPTGTQYPVTRGMEGTGAPAHAPGETVLNILTPASILNIPYTTAGQWGLSGSATSDAPTVGLGFFVPATNVLALATAGVERVRVDATGRVGIGTTSPSQLFHVHPATNENLLVRDNGGVLQLEAANDAGSADVPMRFAASAYYFMPGTGTGFVGIGTASPTSLLHVNGALTAAYSPAGSNLVANFQELIANSGADTAGMWTGIAFNLPSGANRIGGIGLVSRGVGVPKADLFFYGDDGGNRSEKLRLTAEGHLVSSGPTPSLGALQAGMASQSISGTDQRPIVTLTTTATPPGTGSVIAVVSFASVWSISPVVAGVSNSAPSVHTISAYAVNGSGFNFWLSSGAMAASTAHLAVAVVMG